MARHAVAEQVPPHLAPFIAKQDASLYTPIDHASWRFILKISREFFSKHAHQKYLDGLRETGISTERIPLIEEMDQRLRRFGWRAVPVSGFIPPAVFMEFQSLGFLPIACEMRTLDHLAYTPAPDIVHEAAGHAPIIADPEYADYLREYGEVSRKAIFSSADMALYQAIRDLSDIKEDPISTPATIQAAQKRLDETVASVHYVSEATYLARMNWWTVEYGLVGSAEDPLIYGAGLLSSVGESYSCLSPEVRKIPFTIDCVNTSYDITRPQPQLYVTPGFRALKKVLEEFAATMAFRRGGVEGLSKAKMAATVTTSCLDSGLQISGVLSEFQTDANGKPTFLRFTGPTQLAYEDQEVEWQGPHSHPDGFSSPLGPVAGMGKTAAELGEAELKALGFTAGNRGRMRFALSGIELEGVLRNVTRRGDRNLILSFGDCTMKKGSAVLFRPEWGQFDLACGSSVVSVFGGAADRQKYLVATGGFEQKPRAPKTNLTEENRTLNDLYRKVRELREGDLKGDSLCKALEPIHAELEAQHREDWLLRLEILELMSAREARAPWQDTTRTRLNQIAGTRKDRAELVARGLSLL